MSNDWLLLVPMAFLLLVYVLAFTLCYGARKGDEIAEEQRRDDDDLIPRVGGWRT